MIRTSIRRPVAVAMAYTTVALLGAFSWRNIPIELLPDRELPRLSVQARWDGASPETVEAFLTSPLEATINQVRGVEEVSSDSREGQSRIDIEFARDTDMDFARLDLSERIAVFEEDLPPGVGRVFVQPYVPREFRDQLYQPFLHYTFTGPYTLEALREHLDEVVVPALTEIEGVGTVNVSGGRRRMLEVRLDGEKVTALGLTPAAVVQAIRDLDLVAEVGAVREGADEHTITIVNRADGPDAVRRALLRAPGGRVVRLSEVATVHDTYEEARQLSRIDSNPAVSMRLYKEIGANTVRVSEAVQARLAELERLSPFGASFDLQYEEADEIRTQLSDLRVRAGVAAVVIFVVLLGFLRSFRSAGLVFATIAFSVLISLNLVYFGGLTLNLLTLMGLAMGFGLIVDNSIVVLENVYRRWQDGEDPWSAADGGAREVVLPILASTATTLIVFVPFVYLQDELRVFYVPLAIVVGLTLLASLFVAFTFIPALSARLLAGGGMESAVAGGVTGEPGAYRAEGTGGPLYVRFYRALVGFTLRHPWITVAVTLACFGGSWWLFDTHVERGRVWGGGWGSQRTYIDIQVRLPRGSNLERTDQLVSFFEDKLSRLPEVERYEAEVNETFGRITVTFPDSLEDTGVPVAIKERMFAHSLTFTGADVRVYGYGPSFYGGGGSPPNYRIEILGYNYLEVQRIAEDIGRRLLRVSRIQDVDTNASGGFTRDRAVEYTVTFDRAALARQEMTVQEVVGRLRAEVGGTNSGTSIKIAGEEVRLEVKARESDDLDVRGLQETIVTLPDGRGIRLGDVIRVEPREVLSSIRRQNQQYERTVAYEFRGPRKLGDVYQEAIIGATELKPGYTIQEAEGWRWDDEERNQIFMVLLVSVILVYMVTASLFESLRQPLCVLLTVPMALIGVFMIFFYARATFTREAYIGVIMMGGIVVNNAILLVDHVNRVRESRGLPLMEAILQGTLERVRPILMTTATTVLGLLPLVLFSETADANIWNALGFALIGGMIASTFFVLTTTPSLYYLFEKGKEARRRWAGEAGRGPA